MDLLYESLVNWWPSPKKNHPSLTMAMEQQSTVMNGDVLKRSVTWRVDPRLQKKTRANHHEQLKKHEQTIKPRADLHLVGGFNPPEKYLSDWIIMSTIGENNKCSKPPTRHHYLRGSAITIFKNMTVNGKDNPIYIMENNNCSKPPTSILHVSRWFVIFHLKCWVILERCWKIPRTLTIIVGNAVVTFEKSRSKVLLHHVGRVTSSRKVRSFANASETRWKNREHMAKSSVL